MVYSYFASRKNAEKDEDEDHDDDDDDDDDDDNNHEDPDADPDPDEVTIDLMHRLSTGLQPELLRKHLS